MKYYKLLFLYGIIVLAWCSGCSKKNTAPKPTQNSFVYSVTGFADIAVPQFVDTIVWERLNIVAVNGVMDSVTLVPTTVPKGVTFIQPSGAGIANFSWNFTMHVSAADSIETLPVTIRATSPSGDTQYHSFNIIVQPDTFCALAMAGIYNAVTTFHYYNGTDPLFTETDSNVKVTATRSMIRISMSLNEFFVRFNAHISCVTGNLSIDPYHDDGEVEMDPISGTAMPNSINLKYSLYGEDHPGQFKGICETILTKQ